jgi:hypothetical protein
VTLAATEGAEAEGVTLAATEGAEVEGAALELVVAEFADGGVTAATVAASGEATSAHTTAGQIAKTAKQKIARARGRQSFKVGISWARS